MTGYHAGADDRRMMMGRTFERFDERDGLVHGFVVEQTLVGYGVRELVRSPWSQVWRQVGFVDGFGSSAAARGSVDGWGA